MRLRREPDRGKSVSSKRSGTHVTTAYQSRLREASRSPALMPARPGLTENRATGPPSTSSNLLIWRSRTWLPVLLLAAATFLAYRPCLHGDFVWDDDAWTLKLERFFRDASGLGQIWTNLTALQQYYPLTATTFWIDYHLWGFWTLPYHLENVALHVFGAVLFWRLLKRLNVPGAPLAAAVLALHPLMVESAAWITERKNVLSLVLYLGALLCYGRFIHFWQPGETTGASSLPTSGRERSDYAWALLLFLGAYLAKATAFSLPAVLLLTCWWKCGRLRWREDLLPTLPFWGVSLGLGLITSWLERTHVGAMGPDWALSFAERCLIAGRALWFYTGKLIWPVNLCFIYPRWHLDARSFEQWLWPVAFVAVLLALWLGQRRIGRGPVTAVFFFGGTLFPLLGFFNGYFMRYSFVCDHWAYLPSLGLIALGAALVARWVERLRAREIVYCAAIIPVAVLGVLTWRHSALFSDSETLYGATLALNPAADLAHNNLGLLLAQAGEVEEAIPHFEKAVEIRPGSAHAHNNLANALCVTGRPRQAVEQYQLSLKLDPGNANTWNNLALLLATSWDGSVRNGTRAIGLAQRARELTQARNPVVLATLAAAFAEAGRFSDAVATVNQAIQLASSHPNSSLIQALQAQLKLYQDGLPFRESTSTSGAAVKPTPPNRPSSGSSQNP